MITVWFDAGHIKGYRLPNSRGGDDGERRVTAESLRAFLLKHGMPIPPELRATAAVSFGLLAGEAEEFATPIADPFAFGAHLACEKVDAAVIGDTQGMSLALSAIANLRARHPHAVVVLVASEDATGLESLDASVRVFRRPVEWAAVREAMGGEA
jgi:hypothetical protein